MTEQEIKEEQDRRREKLQQRRKEDESLKMMAKMELLQDVIYAYDQIQYSFYAYRKNDEMAAVDSWLRYFINKMGAHNITLEDGIYYLNTPTEKIVFRKGM